MSIHALAGQIHEEPGAVIDLINHRLALESRDAELEGFIEELLGDASRLWSMHHNDRAGLAIELKPTLEDKVWIPGGSATPMRMVVATRIHETCTLRFKVTRYPVRLNRTHPCIDVLPQRILVGDSYDVRVSEDITLRFPLSRPFVDGAKFTGLLCGGWRSDALIDD